jgi:porin
VSLFGLQGHQRFGGFYTTRDLTLLDQDARLAIPQTVLMRQVRRQLHLLPRGLRALGRATRVTRNVGDLDTRPDDWGLYYNFDQYLFAEKEDPTQGVGIFGRFGWTTGQANPVEQFYSFGVGGKGILEGRDKDTFGVGYYCINLSDDLPGILNTSDEQGVEAFYNIQITPWLHITPDFQVITRPGGGFRDRDVALVYGIRAQMTF